LRFDSSNGNTLTNNTISYVIYGDGIWLLQSNNNTLRNNTFSDNKYDGIYSGGSSYNTFINNNLSENEGGIRLLSQSNNNILIANKVSNNYIRGTYPETGIDIEDSSSNEIMNNDILNNYYGIYLVYSDNTRIYLNNFIDNDVNGYSFSSTNLWKSPEEITYTYEGKTFANYTGNYWSDYTGIDVNEDGIGDTPYMGKMLPTRMYSLHGDEDSYPLMQPFEDYLASTPPPEKPPKFLTLPFNDPSVRIQQGWVYTFNPDPDAHLGIDYVKGTIDMPDTWQSFDIVAASDGWAMRSEQPGDTGTYGNFVLVRHDKKDLAGNDYFTLYAHLKTVAPTIPYQNRFSISYDYSDPSKWIYVKRGEIIGEAGKTGAANTGIHLHFEVERKGYDQYQSDPYDLYTTRDAYPMGDNEGCGPNYLWTTDPPRLPINPFNFVKIVGLSPIDMTVITPDGLIISKQTNQVPGATYTENVDFNGDGELDDIITIPERKIGDYIINVIPESGASPTDTYTLKFLTNVGTLVLAENTQIRDIPEQPYIVESTENGVIQIHPDFNVIPELPIGTVTALVTMFASLAFFKKKKIMSRKPISNQQPHALHRNPQQQKSNTRQHAATAKTQFTNEQCSSQVLTLQMFSIPFKVSIIFAGTFLCTT